MANPRRTHLLFEYAPEEDHSDLDAGAVLRLVEDLDRETDDGVRPDSPAHFSELVSGRPRE